jgi:hypothetical protein
MASCASLPKNSDNVTRQIKCGPGPEDIVLDSTSSSPRLLISCNARREGEAYLGEIMEYRFDGQEAKALARTGEPAGFVFNPHGIDIITRNGKAYLYVVTHRDDLKQHFVAMYTVEADRLVFQQLFGSAFMVSPNDCAAGPNGSVYVTNDSGKRGSLGEKLFKKKRANVVMFDSLGNCSVVAEKLAYANGVLVLDTNVYVSTVQQKVLFRYTKNGDGTLKNNPVNIAPYYGYDNITKYVDELIIVAHPKPFKFLGHVKKSSKPSLGITYAVNYKTMASRVVFADDGKRISANSTGLIYKGKLYIAQVFDPFVLEVDLK